MPVQTHLLDFKIRQSKICNDIDVSIYLAKIDLLLRKFFTTMDELGTFYLDGSTVQMFKSDFGNMVTVRIYNDGLITLAFEYNNVENEQPPISFKLCQEIEREVLDTVKGVGRTQVLCPIKRGEVRYLRSSDERLLEYDVDKVIFEKRSKFQKIQILHSKTLGNMLVLDDLQNLSESDLIYTHTLMQKGQEIYKGKDIVILGGGDGALLYELLKEDPKFVTMFEIDELVMQACNKYMKSVCGNVLEKLSGRNYQIIKGDCVSNLDKLREAGRKYDYVFGDLTDMPLSENSTGEKWKFIRRILQLSLRILKPNGKYMTHGNGVCCEESLNLFEEQLLKLYPPVIFTKSIANIPSFLEDWVFYQIRFAHSNV